LTDSPRETLRPDIAMSCAQAQAIVDRVAEGRTVARVSTLHGGEISAVYEIGFSDTSPALVLKVYPDTLQWKMQKEVTVLALLQQRLSVPVPRIFLADDSKSLIGLNFLIMTKLDGDTLRGLQPPLTQAETVSVYTRMGQVLREFHRIPMQAFGYIGPHGVWTPYASNRAFMSFQFEKKLAESVERGG